MRVTLAAARSAPGVTTATLALASACPGRVLIVEASEDGGVIAARFGLALEPGVSTLAAAVRHATDAAAVQEHTQELPGTDGRIEVLVGPPSAEQSTATWRSGSDTIAAMMQRVPDDVTVLVDGGRLGVLPVAQAGITGSDRLVLVARPRLEDLQSLAARLEALRTLGPPVSVLLVGSRPYDAEEVARTLTVPVIGTLAEDRSSADALAGIGSARRLERSPLMRSAVGVVERLRGEATPRTAVPVTAPPARPFTAARP